MELIPMLLAEIVTIMIDVVYQFFCCLRRIIIRSLWREWGDLLD